MFAKFVSVSVLCLALVVSGCATSPSGQPGVAVLVTPSFNVIQAGDAPVTLNSNVDVKWELSSAGLSCTPGCGTLTSSSKLSAVYAPPDKAPINQTTTISAMALSNQNKSFQFNFVITPALTVTINNKFTKQIAGGPPSVLTVTVANDAANAGVTWTLTAGGSNCSPACGTLITGAAAAQYTPPASVPAGANASPVITAASVTNPAVSDTVNFTIVSATSLLKGSYAFLLRGYVLDGTPMSMAGSLTLDGNGAITGGELDINSGGGITAVAPQVSGTYTVDVSFNGTPRGSFSITSFKFPGSNITIGGKFVLSADGKRGRIVEFDGAGFVNMGILQLQDAAALTAANAAGTYVFHLDSDNPVGGRTVAIGQMILGGSGVTGGMIDESKAQDPSPRFSAAAITAGVATRPDGSGRGTLQIIAGGETRDFVYYVVDNDQLLLLEIDNGLAFGTIHAGTAQRQTSLTAASVNMTTVLQMTGMDSPSGTNNIGPAVFVGVLKVTGGTAFTVTFDANDLGAILTNRTGSGTVTFSPASGRGVLTLAGGFAGGFMDSAVFYLYDAGKGFILDADPSTPGGTPPNLATTNNAYSGSLTPQSPGPFSTAASLAGDLLLSSGASSIADNPDLAAAIHFSATGSFNAQADLTSTQIGQVADVSFNGTFAVTDSVLGRATVTLPAGFFGDFANVGTIQAGCYIIDANRAVFIAIQPTKYTGVSFFEPR